MAEISEASEEARSSKRRKYCDHCSKSVGYSTYYKHREQFFDHVTNQWSVESCAKAGACEFSGSSTDTSQDDAADTDGNEIEMNFPGLECRNEDDHDIDVTYNERLDDISSDTDSDSMQEIINNDTDIWLTSSTNSESEAEEILDGSKDGLPKFY